VGNFQGNVMNFDFGVTVIEQDFAPLGMRIYVLELDRGVVIGSSNRLKDDSQRDRASEVRSWHLGCSFCISVNFEKEILSGA
jgi:hypothetical protein